MILMLKSLLVVGQRVNASKVGEVTPRSMRVNT